MAMLMSASHTGLDEVETFPHLVRSVPAARATNAVKVYGDGRSDTSVRALDGVNVEFQPGRFTAIMGPSGSGKSTLMNLVGLLDRPTSGRLVLAGEDATRLDHDRLARLRNRRIGFVFQAYNLLSRNTTLENVEMPLVYSGIRGGKRRQRARDALETVGLLHRVAHWPGELSGGEQQRVAIARAVVGDPAIVLADEPTGALDSHTGASILALFQSLNRAGRTIVMVTHDVHVARHARRILKLQDGAVIGDDPVAEQPDAHGAPDLLRGPSAAAPGKVAAA